MCETPNLLHVPNAQAVKAAQWKRGDVLAGMRSTMCGGMATVGTATEG